MIVILNAAAGPESKCFHQIRTKLGAAFVAAGVRKALDKSRDTIVAAGGDGTVSAVAGQLAGTNKIMGVLPFGTLNHFAKDLGIP